MSPAGADPEALRLAFRLTLLDAVPHEGSNPERRLALTAARDRLAGTLLTAGPTPGLPRVVSDVADRAVLAVALQRGFEDAWASVTQLPFC